jgi:hypothetical protein
MGRYDRDGTGPPNWATIENVHPKIRSWTRRPSLLPTPSEHAANVTAGRPVVVDAPAKRRSTTAYIATAAAPGHLTAM